MGLRDHGGMNLDDDSIIVCQLGHGEQFHHTPHPVGSQDIGFRHRRDALAENLRTVHLGMERQPSKNRCFRSRILALDVSGGISLRETELLSLAQRHLKAQVARGHLVENVVGGAVDDSHDRTDLIPDQGFPQGSNDRNRSRHRCLVVEVDAVFLGRCTQLRQILGQQRLVGGDH